MPTESCAERRAETSMHAEKQNIRRREHEFIRAVMAHEYNCFSEGMHLDLAAGRHIIEHHGKFQLLCHA